MANNMELNRRQFMQVFAVLGASIALPALPALPKSTCAILSPTQFFDTPLKNFDYGVIVDGQKIENIQSISLTSTLDRDGFVSGDGTRLQKHSYTLAISFFYRFSNELKIKNGFVDFDMNCSGLPRCSGKAWVDSLDIYTDRDNIICGDLRLTIYDKPNFDV
jgi:hypothetical protein